MSIELMTPESKKIAVNLSADECLFKSPRDPPSPGSCGVDLYAHKAPSGGIYYYTHAWSMADGSPSKFNLVSEEAARQFLIERAGISAYEYLEIKKSETIEKYFPGIFE